jgi:hypothetical protein
LWEEWNRQLCRRLCIVYYLAALLSNCFTLGIHIGIHFFFLSFLYHWQVQAKEAEVAALRENPFADVPATPSTPKVKGGQTVLCTEEALGANTSSFPDLLKGFGVLNSLDLDQLGSQ